MLQGIAIMGGNVDPTDVRLLAFKAMGADGSIVLMWETASEINTLGFNLYRATSAGGARIKVNTVVIPSLAAPGSPAGAAYDYADAAVKVGKTYYYWLEEVGITGTTKVFGPVRAQAR